MQVVHKKAEVHKLVRQAKAQGKLVGLVPTMGALHEGHLSLIRQARQDTGFVVISIFVNPTQFGPGEDLEAYPRAVDEDQKLAQEEGVDLVFAPDAREMYPAGYASFVEVERLGEGLCGRSRPGHFRGVATVVAKLFHIVGPDIAYFGQKDAQQAAVIKRMAADLDMAVSIRVLPTVRDADGLALSTRNRYLTPGERQDARVLYQALMRAKSLIEEGERHSEKILEAMRKLIQSVSSARVDYIAVVHPETLEEIETIELQALVALAVYIGKTRLIDNLLVAPG